MARQRQRALMLALAMALGCFASVGRGEFVNSRWSVRSWQSDDGLPNNMVLSLGQTPDGYLWLATSTRVARFDGVRFEVISRDVFGAEFAPHVVGALTVSHDGGLWLAMNQGPLVLAHGGALQFFASGLPTENVQSVTEGGDGTVWLSYRGKFVWRVRHGVALHVTEGMPGHTVCTFACDAHGTVWFAQGGTIGTMQGDRFVPLASLPRANLSARVTAAAAGGVWVATNTELYRYEPSQGLVSCGVFQADQRGDEARALLEDRSGGVWIGTAVNGVFHYDGRTFEPIDTTHREILSLLEDREGNIWIGTAGGGLDQVRPRTVELENASAGLPFDSVESVTEDTVGRIWATAQNGWLLQRDAGRWTNLATQPDWPGGLAASVASDGNGGIWIGTRNRLLHHWSAGHYSTLNDSAGLVMRNIHALLATRNGDLWIAGNSPESLQRLRDGKLTRLALPRDVRVIRAATEDSAGRAWFGTSRGQLLRIEGDRVIDETAKMGGIMSIRCLTPDGDGGLWIGFADFGVGRLKDGRFARLGTERGLHDDGISQILPDGHGWIWFGSNQGLFKVEQQELEAALDHRIPNVRSIVFGRSEGVPSLQANAGDAPNAARTVDGRLWMPMTTGLVVVNPATSHGEPAVPPVLLRRVLVDEMVVASYGGAMPVSGGADLQNLATVLQLPPSHRRLELEWTALSFGAPENVRFRYRLDGFDENWTDADAAHVATYSRLPAGRYAFRVQAAQGSGAWNEMKVPLGIVVAPFLWQTWWFELAVLGVFTAAIVATVRYVSFRRLRSRVRTLEQQAALEKERARIARDIHDDVGNRLTKITLLSDLALQDGREPDKAAEHIAKISSTARQITDSLDEIVWAVNPRNDTLSRLIDYIGQFALELLHAANVQLRLDLPESVPLITVPAEVRHNLFLVVKEALNNIVRHAHARTAHLRVVVDSAGIELSVTDDGRGFASAPDNAYADGLRNMRQRMAEIGGEFNLTTQPGSGTNVQLRYRWVALQRN